LLSAALQVTGPVEGGVGVASFLSQTVQRSGEQASLTLRAGLEAEPINDWLQLRSAFYLEPSRFADWHGRLHGTFGFDVKVLPWTIFGLFEPRTWWAFGAFADVAEGYYATGLRIGMWR
jgi:hypothetical protein